MVQTWFWIPEYEFRVNGLYSELAVSELKRRKALGTPENYRSVVHSENADVIAAYQSKQQPIQPEVTEASGLAFYTPPIENTDSIIGGLAIPTKATEKREILKGELVLQEQSNDESWEEFTALMAELQEETEAAQEDDELEFQLLRKQHAAKWLKRKAVLEQDKLRILQGQVSPKNGQSPNGSSVAS